MTQLPIRANPDVNLDVDSLTLNVGLDLASAKLLAEKGSLQDCLNREVVDSVGYRRIDGLDKYDGRVSPTQEDMFLLYNTTYGASLTTDFAAGDLLVREGTTNIFGKVVSSLRLSVSGTDHNYIYYARINKDYEPAGGEVVNVYGETNDFTVDAHGPYVYSSEVPTGSVPSASTVVSSLNTWNTTLRGDITDLDDTPIGLHWFRDKLYAVVTDLTVYFSSGGTTEVQPNYYIKGNTTNTIGRVLSVTLVSGTWGAGTAVGLIQYELISGTGFNTSETLSYDESSGFGTPISADVATLTVATTTEPQYASLWKSRSETQALADGLSPTTGAGWDRIDHGWECDFDNGYSETGSLTAVRRGVENNFSFTSSSVYADAVSILNGNNIGGSDFPTYTSAITNSGLLVADGYPGWKTNASSSVFAGSTALDTALTAADSNYAYATLYYDGYASPYNSSAPSAYLKGADRRVVGPGNNPYFTPQSSVGAESIDSDFFSTQARCPLVFNNFAAAAASIPEGSLIAGVEITITYETLHYGYADFVADRNGTNGANIVSNTLTWMKNLIYWEASAVRSTSDTTCDLIGTPQLAQMKVDPTPANYETSYTNDVYHDYGYFAQTFTGQTATLGGSTTTFGTSITRDDLLDPDFGIAICGKIVGSAAYPIGMTTFTQGGSTVFPEHVYGGVRSRVDRIRFRFYYTQGSARYYVTDNGTDICSVDVIYSVTEDGEWQASTASGSIQFTNLVADVQGSKRIVEDNDYFYLTEVLAQSQTGPVLQAASTMTYNGLASLDRVLDENSRYQFITANFFGRDDWDGFYGVNGADRAFSFATFDADTTVPGDEDYCIRIATNTEDLDGDTPRHIAYHANHLALGYSSGIVRLSVPGEPENFSGIDGAAEVGLGDKVTGMLSSQGNALTIYCENSIHAITGSDVDNYQSQVISPYKGAIEYTAVNIGMPIHCDSRGITTISQSAAYGNFVQEPLSQKVSPWIIPRMIRNNDLFSVADGTGVVCAVPVRSKNQYRLFFKDGYVLVMTMNANGSPSFTFSKYYLGMTTTADTDRFLVPFAWCSQVDNNGVERIHVSHYSDASAVASETTLENYVFELDKGWSFCGNYIPEFYTLNPVFRDPFTETNLRKIRLDGLTRGVADNSVYTAKDYSTTFTTVETDISLTKIGPSTATTTYSADFYPATSMANVAERGRSISIKVEGDGSIGSPVPPDIHQLMLVQYGAGGKRDN